MVLINGQDLDEQERRDEFITGGNSLCEYRDGKSINSKEIESHEVRSLELGENKVGFAQMMLGLMGQAKAFEIGNHQRVLGI